ncbi:MAG: hypothetical protein CL489_10375 [Acidobacteria bacterium]|nr:hypothetical protein [Acidobacteriota bacterium]|tara:strand:+ start:16629 stop:16961 length:333 start_codon:yes stop_codon:yes gene_type:complete
MKETIEYLKSLVVLASKLKNVNVDGAILEWVYKNTNKSNIVIPYEWRGRQRYKIDYDVGYHLPEEDIKPYFEAELEKLNKKYPKSNFHLDYEGLKDFEGGIGYEFLKSWD